MASVGDRRYVSVYYSIVNDERFAEIYHVPSRLGTWLQLLLVADAMFPADAPIPSYVHRPSLKALVGCGLVEIRAHQHFRMHGLASEREMRSHSARNAAAVRWQTVRNAGGMPRTEPHSTEQNRIARGNANGDFDRRVEATKRQLHRAGGHSAETDPECPLCVIGVGAEP